MLAVRHPVGTSSSQKIDAILEEKKLSIKQLLTFTEFLKNL
jgi:hypothetical protein